MMSEAVGGKVSRGEELTCIENHCLPRPATLGQPSMRLPELTDEPEPICLRKLVRGKRWQYRGEKNVYEEPAPTLLPWANLTLPKSYPSGCSR